MKRIIYVLILVATTLQVAAQQLIVKSNTLNLLFYKTIPTAWVEYSFAKKWSVNASYYWLNTTFISEKYNYGGNLTLRRYILSDTTPSKGLYLSLGANLNNTYYNKTSPHYAAIGPRGDVGYQHISKRNFVIDGGIGYAFFKYSRNNVDILETELRLNISVGYCFNRKK